MSQFDQWTAGYAPMAQGIQHTPMTGFEGLPGTNNPVIGTLAPFMAPSVQNWMNGMGMSPLGLSGKNAGDVLSNMRYTEHQNEVLRRAAANDRQAIHRTLKGAAAMANKQWDADKQRAADSFAASYAAIAPSLATMSTDAIDALTGGTSEAGFAVGVMKGARYRQDPLTGLPGMGTDSVSHLTQGLTNLYFEGGKFDRSKNFGFTSSQMGALYDELQRRGMVAGPGTARDQAIGGISMLERGDAANFGRLLTDTLGSERSKAVQEAAKKAGTDVSAQLSKQELEKLAGTEMGTDAVKALDVTRVKNSIDKYAKTVAAMRDIFGDSGRPDAPMAELVRGLEAMTNGSLQQFSTGQAEMLVRQTYALAKSSGVGLEGAMLMQQHGAQVASQLGLSSAYGATLGVTSLATLQAAQQTGIGGLNQWGAMNAEQLAQAETVRTARAAKSDVGNRLGALDQLDERLRTINGKGFAADGNIGRLMSAVKDGRTTFEYTDADGKVRTRSVLDFVGRKNRGALAEEMARESGGLLTAQDLDEQERNTFANEESLTKNRNISAVTGRLSSEEAAQKWVGSAVTNSLRSRLGNRGTAAERTELGRKIATYLESSIEDENAQTEAIAKMMQDAGLTEGMTPEQVKAAAAAQLTVVDNTRKQYGLTGRVANAQMNNAEMRSAQEQAVLGASIKARTNSALTGLGQNTGFVTRLIQAVGKQGDGKIDDAALERVLAESLGGVDNAEIASALRQPLTDFGAAQADYEAKGKKLTDLGSDEEILPTDTPEERSRKEAANMGRAEARKQYAQSEAMLSSAQQSLHKELRKFDTVSAAMDGAEPAAAEPTAAAESGGGGWLSWLFGGAAGGGAAAAGAVASAGGGGGGEIKEIQIAQLVIHRDGSATISAQGPGRGSVPTGVS